MKRIGFFLLISCWLPLFAAEPRIVFIAGEFEYHSKESLPPYAQSLSRDFAVATQVLARPDDEKAQTIPGLEALENADLVVLLVRRMTLPEPELARIRRYVESGKPLIGLRTASHAFENWKSFDHDVLGGNYQNHHGNKLKNTVRVNPEKANDPLLRGVTGFATDGSLYKNSPLQPRTSVFLYGSVEGFPEEPVAWTHRYRGARIFYTSLGHPNDFKEESFRNLLRNAMEWCLDRPLEPRK